MASQLPTTIKVVHQPDAQSTHLVLEESPLPELSDPEDCLVRVHTACPCLNELYWQASFPSLYPTNYEAVPCTEAAGEIVKVPDNIIWRESDFKVGDEVFFRLDVGQSGNLREYSVPRLSQLAHKPKRTSWVDAGATPLSSLTAWQGLFQHGVLSDKAIFGDDDARKTNEKLSVLITGASGVVGMWAVQLAALAGTGRIVALCSGTEANNVRRLGATDVIDYKAQGVSEWVAMEPTEERQVDLVIDCVGGETLASCWAAVRCGGKLLSVSGNPIDAKPADCNKELDVAKWFLVEPKGKQLEQISKLMEDGKCVTKVDSSVSFADFQQAFDKVEERRAKGKVVIKIIE